MHHISEIHVRNYKSIRDAKFRLQGYTPIVGYNNAGKSNIIRALRWLIEGGRLGEEDFHCSDEPVAVSAIVVNVTPGILNQLNETHRTRIEKYVSSETINLQRVQDVPNAGKKEQRLELFNPETNGWDKNPAGIDSAIKALFPAPIHIDAMDDAEADVSRQKASNTIGKLVAKLLEPVKQKHSDDVDVALKNVHKKFSASGSARIEELTAFDKEVTRKLQRIFPGIEVRLDIPGITLGDMFKKATTTLFEGDAERPVSAFGHGTQRCVQIALIQQLAEVASRAGQEGKTTLLTIDEPELYLHPQAIEQLRASLKRLSASGYQVVFSTHSPKMIPAEDVKNTLLVRKPGNETEARHTILSAVEVVADNNVPQYQLLFSLEYASQILFSESVVLTEGKTEQRLLPFIYEQYTGQTLGQDKIALVAQGGVASTAKAMEVLSVMKIPCKAVVDLDYAFRYGVVHEFIPDDHWALRKCKEIFTSNELGINLKDGLPVNKESALTTAEAFEWLAKHEGAQEPIATLHEALLEKNIWLWTKGAIEAHLGLQKKDEQEWAQFKQAAESNGIDDSLDDAVRKMLQWLRDDATSDASTAGMIDLPVTETSGTD